MAAAIEWERPIFVVGTGRSGTTYLTHILNQHPYVVLTYESNVAHLFKFLHTAARLPPDVEEEVGRFRLVGFIGDEYREHILRLFTEGIRPFWQRFIAERFAAKPFRRWGDKIVWPFVLPELIQLFPQAQFIHIVRDGRDQIVSARRFRDKLVDNNPERQAITIPELCRRWVASNRTILDALPDAASHLQVRYEQLVTTPAAVVTQVLNFLDLPPAAAVAEYIQRPPGHEFSAHATSATPAASIGRWRRELSPAEQAEAEEIMGEMLRTLGYL